MTARMAGPDLIAGEEAQPEAYPSAAVGWVAVVVLFVLYVLSMLDRNLLALLIVPIQADLGVSDFELSLLYGLAFGIFYAVMGLPLGWLIDRYSRRLVIFWGVVGWSLATVACGLARDFVGLFTARAGVGAGESALVPGSQSVLADLFPPDRLALPLSIYSMGSKIGQGAALLIGGVLTALIPPGQSWQVPVLGEMGGWQIIFIVVGLPGVLLAFLIFAIPEPKRRRVVAAQANGYGDYLRFFRKHWKLMTAHHLATLLFLAVSLVVVVWTPAFLVRAHGWSEAQVGTTLGLALVAAPLLGMPLHGFLVDLQFRRGRSDIHLRYSMITALVGTPIGIAAYLVPDPAVTVLLVGLFFFVICGYGSLPAVALQLLIPGNLRGKAAAVMLLICGLGGTTLGPAVVGGLNDFVFQDPRRVGDSILISLGIMLPVTAMLYGLCIKPMGAALGKLHGHIQTQPESQEGPTSTVPTS